MLLSTTEVLDALQRANPGARLTEDRLRHAIRRRQVAPESRFAGRLVWTAEDMRALADALGLSSPGAEALEAARG